GTAGAQHISGAPRSRVEVGADHLAGKDGVDWEPLLESERADRVDTGAEVQHLVGVVGETEVHSRIQVVSADRRPAELRFKPDVPNGSEIPELDARKAGGRRHGLLH